jgi:hypothetical protein
MLCVSEKEHYSNQLLRKVKPGEQVMISEDTAERNKGLYKKLDKTDGRPTIEDLANKGLQSGVPEKEIAKMPEAELRRRYEKK